jgi:hypothetical protein
MFTRALITALAMAAITAPQDDRGTVPPTGYGPGGTTVALADGGTAKALTAAAGAVCWSDADSLELTAAGSSGQLLRSAGTSAPTWTGETFPASTTANQLLYSSATNTVAGLATGNSSVLVTSSGGVPSLATDIPTAVTIGGAAIYRAGGTDVALLDGGTNASLTAVQGGVCYGTASALALSAAGTSGALLQSAGTSAPAYTTATYPSTCASGSIVQATGTNVIGCAATMPSVTGNLIVGGYLQPNTGLFTGTTTGTVSVGVSGQFTAAASSTGISGSADVGWSRGGSHLWSATDGGGGEGKMAAPGEVQDVATSCTKGEIMIDTGGATVEICVCTATNTIRCVATATTNPLD